MLVRLSCGSLYSVYLSSTRSMSVLAYWKRRLALLKMISAISQSHSTLSSYAFFISPNLRLVNVTWRAADGAEQERTRFGMAWGRGEARWLLHHASRLCALECAVFPQALSLLILKLLFSLQNPT